VASQKELSSMEIVLVLAHTEHSVYLNIQVETVGDKYMAVSGLPEPCQTHARCIARLALDMMDLGREVQVDGEPVVRSFLQYEASSGVNIQDLMIMKICRLLNDADHLCGLVVRVSGYRFRGPGFDSRYYQTF
jgi:hypothetical protein